MLITYLFIQIVDAAAASRILDTNESLMANFFNMRGWLVVDAPKYNKDMQLLKDYKSGWAHISPTATPSQVLVDSISNGDAEKQQVVALNTETPRPCDQLKQWSKLFSYLLKVISCFKCKHPFVRSWKNGGRCCGKSGV